MRALAGLVVVAAIAACGGAKPATKALPAQKLGPPVDEKKAQKDASGLVGEVYETIGRGDTKDGLFTLLSDRLVVLGPRKLDAFGTRADALVALQDLIDPRAKKKTPMRSGSLRVVASPGGRSAWMFDVVTTDGGPMALTAILTSYDDLWSVETVALARMPAHDAVKLELARDGVVPPAAAMKARMVESPHGPPLKGAVDKFTKGLLDPQVWGDDLMDAENALVVGPEAGEVARGGKDVTKLWQKRIDARTRAAASGEIAAAVTVDGELAWVSAAITRVSDGMDPLPLRAFAIFAKAGTTWKLIALHESLAIDAPGAGAPWKKILPPKAPEPKEPPPVVAKATEEKSEKPKKKAEPVVEEAPKKKSKKVDEVAVEAPKKKSKKAEPVVEETKKKVKKAEPVVEETPKKKTEAAPKKKNKKTEDEVAAEPPKKKKKPKAVVEDDDADGKPKKKKLKKAELDDEPDETPKKKKKKPVVDDDEADTKPKKKKKPVVDDDEADTKPKKKKLKKADKLDDEPDETPKKKKKKPVVDDEPDEKPAKKKAKKKKASDDDDIKVDDD
ncbi:MAG: nuclear transport factor 2 family protein [Deltaproteobacteria bacterium]|nr:nuclear transport factor 2 family protein [Deltaproteobacteria bacterium]